jgi:hypothetical protein
MEIMALLTTDGAMGATRHKKQIQRPSRVIAASSRLQVAACWPSQPMTRSLSALTMAKVMNAPIVLVAR